MDKNQISLLKESYMKESARPDGRKSTLGEYMRFITDTNLEFVSAKDAVFTDDTNGMVHCVCVNEDMVSQASFPVKIISAAYEDIHAIEAIMSRENFKKFLEEGFLKDIMKSSQKDFLIKWIDGINIQAQQPMRPTPYYDQTAQIISMPSRSLTRDDEITTPTSPATLASKVVITGVAVSSMDDLESTISTEAEIILTSDIEVTRPLIIDTDTVIDLNGKKLINSTEGSIIKATNGANVTIKGNGVIDLGNTSNKSYVLDADGEGTVLNILDGYYSSGNGSSNTTVAARNGATINISNGEFISGSDEDGYGNACVETNGGSIFITGGVFECTNMYMDRYWVLNKKDNTDSIIVVTGGTFINFDPSNGNTENPNESFVAEGYHVEVDVNKYTVVAD